MKLDTTKEFGTVPIDRKNEKLIDCNNAVSITAEFPRRMTEKKLKFKRNKSRKDQSRNHSLNKSNQGLQLILFKIINKIVD